MDTKNLQVLLDDLLACFKDISKIQSDATLNLMEYQNKVLGRIDEVLEMAKNIERAAKL